MDDFFAPTEAKKYMVNPRLGACTPMGISRHAMPKTITATAARALSLSLLSLRVCVSLRRAPAVQSDSILAAAAHFGPRARALAEYKTVKAVERCAFPSKAETLYCGLVDIRKLRLVRQLRDTKCK
jgi:hypothetical protein